MTITLFAGGTHLKTNYFKIVSYCIAQIVIIFQSYWFHNLSVWLFDMSRRGEFRYLMIPIWGVMLLHDIVQAFVFTSLIILLLMLYRRIDAKVNMLITFFSMSLIAAIYFINPFLFWWLLSELFVVIFINIFILAHCLVIYTQQRKHLP